MTEHFVYSTREENAQANSRATPEAPGPDQAAGPGANESAAHYDTNRLFDELRDRTGSADDDELAHRLDVPLQLVAGLRDGSLPLRPSILLSFSERTGIPVDELLHLLGERRSRQRMPTASEGKAGPVGGSADEQ